MATCNATELLAEAKCLMCLSEKQLDLVTMQLMREWTGDTSTPNQLMNDARCFNCLDTKQLDMAQAQLLCDIAG